MAGDIRGTRAAAAGAVHVTVAGDTQHGSTQRSDGRMYQLIRQHDGLRQRTLEITSLASDAEAYSFTFG